jgi:hypothetical protein
MLGYELEAIYSTVVRFGALYGILSTPHELIAVQSAVIRHEPTRPSVFGSHSTWADIFKRRCAEPKLDGQGLCGCC